MNKALSMILSFVIILSMLSVIPISAAGTGASQPYAAVASFDDIEKEEYADEDYVDPGIGSKSGQTGDCTWTLNGTELTVSGEGDMQDYRVDEDTPAPWGADITKVTIENGVTSVGSYAFYNCAALSDVTIADSVDEIHQYAFAGCKDIKAVGLPASLYRLDAGAFASCTGLAEILIPQTLTVVDQHELTNFSPFCGCTFTKAVIEDGATAIPDYLFYDCAALSDVTIPSSVSEICEYAFAGCKSIKTIELPKKLYRMGARAFENCTGLTEILIPQALTIVDQPEWTRTSPFCGCTFTKAVIENGAAAIPDYLFNDCTALSDVAIPESVTQIGEYAFAGCKGIKTVDLPKSLYKLDARAFENCTGLTEIVIPKALTVINQPTWPNAGPFGGCTFTKAVIENEATVIPEYLFYDCAALSEVTLPDSVEVINEYAFAGCSGIKTIALPKYLYRIDARAFEDCTGLTEIFIPKTLTIVDQTEWTNAGPFNGCTFTKAVIEDGASLIPGYLFYDCTALSEITIPASVEVIEADAFAGCADGLTVVGYTGSPAESFAKEHGYSFMSLGIFKGVYILGDTDGDRTITSVDATLIMRVAANLKTAIDLSVLINGDADGSGALEITDATWIQRYLAHAETPYAIGERICQVEKAPA